MHPAGNQTPDAETFGDQRYGEYARAVAAIVLLSCGLVALGVVLTEVHHALAAFIYIVLALAAFVQAWQLVRDPIKALLREIAEPFDVWDD